ncbi:MAG: HAD-IIB family hydrolase [Bacillota bacterium]|nr:HAD-IIB family hydrolase [Bacillota bacterium]
MIKLFVTDLDGTLLAKHHQADEKINDMIKKVNASGAYFAFATGRAPNRATPEEIDQPMYKICMNGAIIADSQDTILYRSHFHKDVLKELLETFPEMDFECFTSTKSYRRCSQEEWEDFMKKPFQPKHLRPGEEIDEDWRLKFMMDMAENIRFSQSVEDILSHDICKVNLHLRHRDYDTDRLDAFLEKHKDSIVNLPCDTGMYELTNVGTDKGSAVSWLAHYLNIQEQEVATYGDGGNDIPMLTRFEHSYSPCNGLDYVKKEAKHIIGPHYEYSVTNHILQTLEEA